VSVGEAPLGKHCMVRVDNAKRRVTPAEIAVRCAGWGEGSVRWGASRAQRNVVWLE
jgi:hypothetical protein